ncbi:hypothetical protein [Streptomyces shenzhenensis]|uniref:hypothetical protein n=1 Tax=Streptomyces shenzhenensis TaxID=943815 RepID=UPI0015F04B42|nr:hypothetical protein [Streptomyces shenzhenensis]
MTNKMISSEPPAAYMAGIAPERLDEQWIPEVSEPRSLDRFPDFLAARRRLLAHVLNRILGFRSTPDRTPTGTSMSHPPARR